MTSGWREVVDRPDGRPSRSHRWIPLLAAAALLGAGWRGAAGVVLTGFLGLAVLGRTAPSARQAVDRGLARLGKGVGVLLTALVLGAVELLVFAPVALVLHVTGGKDPAPGSWLAHRPATARRAYAEDPGPAAPRSPIRRFTFGVIWSLGALALLICVDYGAGRLWDARHGVNQPSVTPEGTARPRDPLSVALGSGGARARPWSPDYVREIEALRFEWRPYLLSRVADVDGRYVHEHDGVRRSTTSSSGDDPAVVWFLGGGASWGMGQRDDRTIPSRVVRSAEAAGVALQAVNLAQPGYTTWQSALLLEQQLATRPPPDLVVFYDGADDVAVQLERSTDDPSHYNAASAAAVLWGRDSAGEQLEEWWESYQDVSVVRRLARPLAQWLGVDAAGADERDLGDRFVAVRRRSLDLACAVAGLHDVPVLFALQASAGVPGDAGAYRGQAVSGPTVPACEYTGADLRDALDGDAAGAFIDGVITDEAGARIVAEQLWPHVLAGLGSSGHGESAVDDGR